VCVCRRKQATRNEVTVIDLQLGDFLVVFGLEGSYTIHL